MIVLLVREIERARGDGEIHPEVDAFYNAMFFLLADFEASETTMTRRSEMDWIWEILRYVAAWGGTGLVIWFWYWMFSSIGTF